MTKRSLLTKSLAAAGLFAAFTLVGCAEDDGYRHRGYTSMSVGVSSDDEGRSHHHRHGYRDEDHDGVPNRYDRDRDGDGVPNRVDDAPRDPNRY